MKHDSYFHPLKVTLGFLAIILLMLLLGGCVAFPLPVEGGLAK